MLYRDTNGKLIQINRLHFHNDRDYYIFIINLKKKEKKVILNEYPLVNNLYNLI
jgi:hypothetical protein